MDNHVRDELAQTVRKARAAIHAMEAFQPSVAVDLLISFGQDYEAIQRDSTAQTRYQASCLRNHLLLAYLRKCWYLHPCTARPYRSLGNPNEPITYISKESEPCQDADY